MYLVASRQYPLIMNMCVQLPSLSRFLWLSVCIFPSVSPGVSFCLFPSVSPFLSFSPFASFSVCLFHSVSLSPSHLLCLSLVLVFRLSLPFSLPPRSPLLSLFLLYPYVSPLCLPLSLFRLGLFHALYLIFCLTPYALPSDFSPFPLYFSLSDSPPCIRPASPLPLSLLYAIFLLQCEDKIDVYGF